MRLFVLACVAAVLGGQGLGAAVLQDDLAAVPRISQADFKKGLARDAVLVLDVRDAVSYANGHIAGAVSMPLDEVKNHVAELKAQRRPIVTYCA